MTPEQIAELERAMAQKNLSPLPLTIVGNDEYAWLKASDGVFVHSPEGMNPDDAKLFAALANACDAGLLDAARKGLEAKRDIDCLLETQSNMVRNREELLSQLSAVTAERDALRERLICEYCDGDVNAPEAEPVQFGACRKCLERLQGERDRLLKDWCPKCGRKFATVNDFRAIAYDQRAADGLCPTRYAFRDPDAKRDCDAAAAARQSQEKTSE